MTSIVSAQVEGQTSCQYNAAHDAGHIAASHHEQGWIQLDGGVLVFDDGGELWPDGTVIPAHRAAAPHRAGVAS